MNFSELQLYCLDKMEIDLYLSRQAIESHPEWLDAKPAGNTPSPVVATEQTSANKTDISNLLDRVREKVEADSGASFEVEQKVLVDQQLNTTESPFPQFNLVVYRTQYLLLIDSLPQGGNIGIEYRRFIADLFFACGFQSLCEPELFQWPLVENPLIEKHEAAAKESLSFWLSARFDKEQQAVLLLGESAQQYCQLDTETPLNFHSVAQIFETPALKAELWQLLQPVIRKSS